jgi:nucleoside-diphosphate-sugar epimerase
MHWAFSHWKGQPSHTTVREKIEIRSRDMNALITGATGYIGFNVSQAVRRAGHSVISLVLDGSRAAMLEKNEIMFAGPTQPTVRELVSAIVRVTGFSGSAHYLPLDQALQSMGPNAEAIALDLDLDSSKAQRLLGWKARQVGFIPEAETYFASWKAWRFSGEVVHAIP